MIFAATRYFLIGVLLVLNIAMLVLSSSVFVSANSDNIYRPIYVYLIFLSSFSCVFLIPIALIDFFLRKNAIPLRVFFELGWLAIFWIMHLAGASVLTATSPCAASGSCNAAQHTLLIFSWLAVSDLLVHLGLLLLIALWHMNDIPDIWSMGVRGVPRVTSRDKQSEAVTHIQEHPRSGEGQQQHRPHQQSQPQSSRPQLWHGRRRSRVISWRDRYPSQSFGSHDSTSGDVIDPARTFYPFLGQGPDAVDTRAAHQETMLQPLPVAFTFERSEPPQQPAQPTEQIQPTRRRDSNYRRSNVYSQKSQTRQLPAPPHGPQQQSHSRSTLRPLPDPQSSRRISRRTSTREARQPPSNISRSQSQQSQQRPQETQPREPPADSLLFSTPEQISQQTQERPRRGPPPPITTRLLPDTTAFYGTAVQSALRDQGQDAASQTEPGDDRRSTTRVYASTPKPKPMSEAQAYAAEAMRRSRTTTGASGSGRR